MNAHGGRVDVESALSKGSTSSIYLPAGASWHDEGWSGGFLPYSAVVDGGEELLTAFMQAVFEGTHSALS